MPPTPAASDGGVFEQISERLHPRTFLADLLPALHGLAPVARVGIGLLDPAADRFRVLALATTDRIARGGENETFPLATTAAGWVHEHHRPFVGSSIRDVRPFDQTHEYFIAEQMQSNCILPLDLGAPERSEGVVYFVSHRPDAFPHTSLPTLDNVRDAVAAQVESFLHLRDTASGNRPPAGRTATTSEPSEAMTLDDAQRQHIQKMLERTGGVIEGPRGAARILGLAPSTLRNRMRRLGMEPRRSS